MAPILTDFAVGRHFNSSFAGTKIIGYTPEEFEVLLDREYSPDKLEDGYAPFCKHLWIPNTLGVRAGVAPIGGNEHCLHTAYEARRAGELPVLVRWLEGVEAPEAEWLDVVLYSEAQLSIEGVMLPEGVKWGVVSINAELQRAETPLGPMTQLRNALGVDQGGSGKALNHATYMAAVEFWALHAVVRNR